jgi:hypothetical protein
MIFTSEQYSNDCVFQKNLFLSQKVYGVLQKLNLPSDFW